jgi:hypothetical protein
LSTELIAEPPLTRVQVLTNSKDRDYIRGPVCEHDWDDLKSLIKNGKENIALVSVEKKKLKPGELDEMSATSKECPDINDMKFKEMSHDYLN